MKHKNISFLVVIAPIFCLFLGLLLVLSHKGRPLEFRPVRLASLDAVPAEVRIETTEVLLLSEEENELLTTIQDTLDEMRIGWMLSQTFDPEILETVHTVLLCNSTFSDLEGENAVSLMNWVEQGGKLGLMTTPEITGWFRIVSHKLGVIDTNGEYLAYRSLGWKNGVLSVFDDLVFDEEIEDYALSLFLSDDCNIHMFSSGEKQIPLLWTRDLGKGRVAVCNHSLILGKDSRGFVVQTLQALEDILIYPIINAALIFIDDFPAPQPEGFDESLKNQYGLTTQGFFRNHWWPDMKALARNYNLRYTGVLVETYNKNMNPPFEPDMDDNSLIRYYSSEVLQSGGEIGLHGYNHQPLCLNGWQYLDEDYLTWASERDMAEAVKELVNYGNSFLPDAEFTSYVPPSNYLSKEGQQVLVETVPSLQVISGLYLPETGRNALVQEFHEEVNGIVPVPRITSGFSMGTYEKTVAEGELSLHGIFSHFIHPDDVLDEERGALLGWETLSADFQTTIELLIDAYPSIRWCTATEAAAAVQRYDRVSVSRSWEGKTYRLELSNFYDEVWLNLCAETAPTSVKGADLYPAGNSLWLRANQPLITLTWEDKP